MVVLVRPFPVIMCVEEDEEAGTLTLDREGPTHGEEEMEEEDIVEVGEEMGESVTGDDEGEAWMGEYDIVGDEEVSSGERSRSDGGSR